jgi:hypothetical protein
MKRNRAVFVIIIFLVIVTGISFYVKKNEAPAKLLPVEEQEVPVVNSEAKKRVLMVNSYHQGYPWSDGLEDGVRNAFNISVDQAGNTDLTKASVNLKIVRMDTKRNITDKFKTEAGIKVRNVIEAWKPDVVITADDNAFKYLVMPYYKNHQLPFVFCGVNWDVGSYDNAPYTNTTGMIEVVLFSSLVDEIQKYSKGKRLGYLGGNTLTARKNYEYMKSDFNIKVDKVYFVSTFQEWQEAYIKLQTEVDALVWINNAGISDWDGEKAREVVMSETKIPTGTVSIWLAGYTLMVFAQDPQEQGTWAANTALKILDGVSPDKIPVVRNKKAKILLNMKLAKKLGIKFSMDLIDMSTFVGDD